MRISAATITFSLMILLNIFFYFVTTPKEGIPIHGNIIGAVVFFILDIFSIIRDIHNNRKEGM